MNEKQNVMKLFQIFNFWLPKFLINSTKLHGFVSALKQLDKLVGKQLKVETEPVASVSNEQNEKETFLLSFICVDMNLWLPWGIRAVYCGIALVLSQSCKQAEHLTVCFSLICSSSHLCRLCVVNSTSTSHSSILDAWQTVCDRDTGEARTPAGVQFHWKTWRPALRQTGGQRGGMTEKRILQMCAGRHHLTSYQSRSPWWDIVWELM